MASRGELLARASRLMLAGESVDIVGDRRSGRSTFIDQLHHLTQNQSLRTLRVQGIASFRNSPMTALAIAGVSIAEGPRPASIPATIAKLADTYAKGTGVIFVDDWDDLDEASWGVISSVHRSTKVPVVLSRLRGMSARHTPSGLSSSSLDSAYTVDIGPMRFDELSHAVQTAIGGPVEEGAMSRIYAKSGGLIGFAIALAESAVREDRMVLNDGSWVATQDLWTGTLDTLVESLLEPLDASERDALEEFSLLGIVDLATVEDIVDFTVIESLEARSLLELYPAGAQTLVTVRPPLLVEYFRHQPLAARRQRLQRVLAERLDPAQSVSAEPAIVRPGDHSAMFVRFVHEQARMRRLIAAAEWERTPSAQTAIAYLEALRRANGGEESIDQLIRWSPSDDEDELSRVEWIRHRLEHLAYDRNEHESAVAQLREAAAEHPSAGGILLASAAVIEHSYLRDTDLTMLPDAEDSELDPRVRATVLVALAYVYCCRAEFRRSLTALGLLRDLNTPDLPMLPSIINGLGQLGLGNLDEARRIAERGMDEARTRFDATILRGYSYLGMVVAIYEGRISDADEIVDSALMLGEPVVTPPFAQIGLMNAAVVIAARRGQRRQAMSRLHELERLPLADGALPSTTRNWAKMGVQLGSGERRAAAQTALTTAAESWQRGAVFTGALAYITALEAEPNPEVLAEMAPRIRALDSPFFDQQLSYVEALTNDDPDELERVAETLTETRPMLALLALVAAAERFDVSGEIGRAERAREKHDRLISSLSPLSIDTAGRFDARLIELTHRELEVARLAAAGMTNQQIADELVLSVRTVESHVHRVMRKTGSARRHDLRGFLAGSEQEFDD